MEEIKGLYWDEVTQKLYPYKEWRKVLKENDIKAKSKKSQKLD